METIKMIILIIFAIEGIIVTALGIKELIKIDKSIKEDEEKIKEYEEKIKNSQENFYDELPFWMKEEDPYV